MVERIFIFKTLYMMWNVKIQTHKKSYSIYFVEDMSLIDKFLKFRNLWKN